MSLNVSRFYVCSFSTLTWSHRNKIKRIVTSPHSHGFSFYPPSLPRNQRALWHSSCAEAKRSSCRKTWLLSSSWRAGCPAMSSIGHLAWWKEHAWYPKLGSVSQFPSLSTKCILDQLPPKKKKNTRGLIRWHDFPEISGVHSIICSKHTVDLKINY